MEGQVKSTFISKAHFKQSQLKKAETDKNPEIINKYKQMYKTIKQSKATMSKMIKTQTQIGRKVEQGGARFFSFALNFKHSEIAYPACL